MPRTTRSSSARSCRRRRSRTWRRLCETPCGSPSPVRLSRSWSDGVPARRSWSSRRSCRFREHRPTRDRRRSRRRSPSSSGSASPRDRQTILVAGGLSRRAGQRELESLLAPSAARGFHGTVEVHDAEDPELVLVGSAGRTPLRVNRLLVDTDLVVTVTAAETVLHGGPGALLGAASTEVLRGAGAYSLLQTAASRGWLVGRALEARSGRARAADRRLADPRSAPADRPLPRLPVRGELARAPCALAASLVLAAPLRRCAGACSRTSGAS